MPFILTLLLTALVAGSNAHAASIDEVKLSLLSDEGTQVDVDWRTYGAWVWNKESLAYQAWIEAPRDLAEAAEAPGLQLKASNAGAPFSLKTGFVFLVIHLTGPDELIPLKVASASGAAATKAIHVKINYSETTWMRHPSCANLNPFLEERSGSSKGPLFLSLYCQSVGDKAVIHVASSDEISLDIIPSNGARFKNDRDIEITKVAGDQTYHSLARIGTVIAGKTIAQYELAYVPAPLPAVIPTLATSEAKSPVIEKRVPNISGEIAASNFSSRDRGRMAKTADSVQPLLRIGWHSLDENQMRAEITLPISTGGDSGFSIARFSKDVGGFRAWQSNIRPMVGVQAFRAIVRGPQRLMADSISPTMGAHGENWEASLAPFGFGPGQFLVANGRLSLPVNEESFSNLRATIDGLFGRSLGQGENGWLVSGISVGLKGEF